MTNEVPDSKIAERGLAVAKAGLSAVPVLGGPAGALLDLVVQPQIDKRRTWPLRVLTETTGRVLLSPHVSLIRSVRTSL